MRYILVPPNITVTHPATGKPIEDKGAFTTFVLELLADGRFNANIHVIDLAFEIKDAVERWEAKPTKYLALENAHYQLLNAVAIAPQGGYQPGMGIQLRPFIKAVQGALESLPVEPSKEPATPVPGEEFTPTEEWEEAEGS